jgi:histidinol-phosphate aminotransferase
VTSPLRHHGDVDAAPGLVDFAVNVRVPSPPEWLRTKLVEAIDDLGRYPSRDADLAAREAVAARHGREPGEVLILNGAAEGFAMLPKLQPRSAVVVHPSFTEPEAALTDASIPVHRHLLTDTYELTDVPEADLVVVGNPTNPTSVLHPKETLRRIKNLLVDEAFMDAIPGEPESLAQEGFVLRSLTKTWGLAGLRAGYFLGDPDTLAKLNHNRPQWPVNSLALAAVKACSEAIGETERAARETQEHIAHAADQLKDVLVTQPRAPFVLIKVPKGTREALRDKGIAARRCDTFPGLDDEHLRVAVRPPEEFAVFVDALRVVMEELR